MRTDVARRRAMERGTSTGAGLYHEERGQGVPILMIHPSGSTASTWGSVVDDLATVGRVITYDRRGYARSGGDPVRRMSVHTADAATLLEALDARPAVVVGTSSGAMIALDLAVRRPDLVRAVIEHEGPWRFTRRVPAGPQAASLLRIGSLVVRGLFEEGAEALLRSAYSYRDGGTAWDGFPDEWRRIARENAKAALWDFVTTVGNRPPPTELATISVPVVCSYGGRSPDFMIRCTRSIATTIPTARTQRIDGAAHAVPFDAPSAFGQLIAEAIASTSLRADLLHAEPQPDRTSGGKR
jgi:pimeloyl-ACP methyl ester carboxylesterase